VDGVEELRAVLDLHVRVLVEGAGSLDVPRDIERNCEVGVSAEMVRFRMSAAAILSSAALNQSVISPPGSLDGAAIRTTFFAMPFSESATAAACFSPGLSLSGITATFAFFR
jgi:hypothetical protein